MDLVDAANDLAALLEAAAPRQGLTHPRHARTIKPARRKIERVMRAYFRRQESALLAEVKPKIRAREASAHLDFVSIHPREASGGGILYAQHVIPVSIHAMRFPPDQAERDEYASAIGATVRGAVGTIKGSLLSGEDAAGRYLRDHSLMRLTGDIAPTTVKRLRDAVADAWDKGGSYNQIVSAIQDTFQEFSDYRAGMIAQTEVNDAYNLGRMATATAAGMTEKAWDPDGEACPICLGNVDAGWIDIEADFPSGDAAPTAHPNCDCSIDFQK